MTPRRTDTHEEYEELAAGHALGALEPEDEQRFLAHLPCCARCERALAEHVETAAHLAYAAEPVDVPDSLLEGLRAQLRADARPPAPVTGGQPVAPVTDLGARRRLHLAQDRRVLSAAAALLVVLVGLVGWNASLQRDNQQKDAMSEQLSAAVRTMTDEPSRSVPLHGKGNAVTAVAVLAQNHVSLVVDGLEPNDAATTTYVLWERARSGDVRAVGTFDVRAGQLEVVRNLPLNTGAEDVTELAVTEERGNSAPSRPSRDPVAAGTVDEA